MGRERYCYRDVLPFTAMVTAEFTNVGLNTLFKTATQKGMSYYVFIVYSFALATLVLLPLQFIFRRPTVLPPFSRSLFFKICLLGLIGFSSQMVAYAGIEYSSPTLASAMSNLTPAFTFMLAVMFRMEKVALRSSSTQAKIMGTIVLISGAIVVVLYKGPTLISTPSSSSISLHHQPLSSSQSNWIIGSLLLAAEYLLLSIWYILQTQVMKTYPAELLVVLLYNLCATIISAPVCLIVERNLSAWIITSDIAIVAIVYSGFFGSSFSTAVHTWGLHLKGPVYISMFKPLSIAIAAIMGVIFLGDSLYLGSVIGAIIISIGFYAVMWAKAKEEMGEDYGVGSLDSSSNQKVPLLQSYEIQET